MSSFSLLILSAGFGKRMLDLTKNVPKPLLKFNNKILLGNTINFFQEIGCNEIFINTHYLNKKIEKYIYHNYSQSLINVIFEPKILGTGGGVKNIFNYTKSDIICVVNSDIFWKENNKLDISNFLNDLNSVSHCKLLLSKKKNFIGLKNDKGDFNIKDNKVINWSEGKEIIFYSGLQIISKKVFDNNKKIFSMKDVWDKLILYKNLQGKLSESNIIHIGDKKSFHTI